MTKSKKAFDKTKGILVVVIGILVLILVLLVVRYPRPTIAQQNNNNISMGSLKWSIKNNRAVPRDDELTKGLKTFLVNTANNSGCSVPAYYSVIAINDAETQVFLGYGCDSPGGRTFAVKQGNTWKELSPTNQFNFADLPSCELTDGNNISVEIAPVCFVAEGTESSVTFKYRIRS